MIFCPDCGKEVAPDARFCRSCGTALQLPTSDAPDATQTTPVPSTQKLVFPPSRAGAILLMLLLVGGSYFLGSRNQNKGSSSEVSNSAFQSPNEPDTVAATPSLAEGSDEPDSENASEGPVSEDDLRSTCQSNLKQIGLAVMQYMQDYDEGHPLVVVASDNDTITKIIEHNGQRVRVAVRQKNHIARNGPYGWADSLQPYTRSTQIFQCPSESNSADENPVNAGFTDYYYNSNLDNKMEKDVSRPDSTVMLGEGISSNARYARTAPEPSAETRHKGGSSYAFADGHVKWFYPGDVSSTAIPIHSQSYTFRVK